MDEIPAARQRFLAGELPDCGQLLVRYRLGTGGESTWAHVSSWSDEDHAVVRDVGREFGPGVRAGSSRTVATRQIIG
jgi:hypothetical protein